ncbi:serine/threonine protein kinase [Variovorax sp. VNK109]|uniref:serine/threonine protein kinase n=1 Tax=Variovorax sp. VNK109 TaxID=3400919 RepID=UPI003BFB0E68
MPSLVIEEVAAESGQRVVYFGHFEDQLIPADMLPPNEEGGSTFLRGWEDWGRVVIKVVENASPEALTRLQAETAILADVRPQNFPELRFSNLFVDNPVSDEPLPSKLYVSIEAFVVSQTLGKAVAEYRANPQAIVDLCLGIANALFPLWMHPKRFVHRDLKPENILIRPNGEVVVIDLGIVRETGGTGITKAGWGNAPLTLDFAAPEQIANDKEAISFKTDFFAIGVLMYLLASGIHPFRTSRHMAEHELALAIEQNEPKSLHEIGVASPEFSGLVEWLMKKTPYSRPRTPSMLIEKLEELKRETQ